MTVAVKNNNKTPLVVPPAVRREAGFKSGQELEFKASGGVITIVPKLPAADDEYTPEQRRAIDAELDEAEQRPFHGPFKTADETISHLKGQIKERATPRKRSSTATQSRRP
jgi:bifunctional DNA-binding transcriptional regulator/antitoxin component of YhaV-PrlF toxin-antitoxin module